MEKAINVLSLFDGMSCGQIALNQLGKKVDKYFASEIDKYAIKVTKMNYPNTIHLGDVRTVKAEDLPKIDLLLGGSPCQGFSFAGKQLNFADPRSKLFFEYVRILKELKKINPEVKFLLENVKMKKAYEDVITQHLGVEPIEINSALLSAQNRKRLYWTNINVEQPEDRGIYLEDILEEGVTDRYKSYCLDASYFKGASLDQYFTKCRRQLVFKDGLALAAAQRGRYLKDGKRKDIKGMATRQRIETSLSGKSNCLTSAQKDSLVLIIPEATKKGFTEVKDGECFDGTFPKSKTRRGRLMKEKANCLTATNCTFLQYKDGIVRKLTVTESERLQTVPDGYTSSVSDPQRYKMLGNGWTVEVIKHILKNI